MISNVDVCTLYYIETFEEKFFLRYSACNQLLGVGTKLDVEMYNIEMIPYFYTLLNCYVEISLKCISMCVLLFFLDNKQFSF